MLTLDDGTKVRITHYRIDDTNAKWLVDEQQRLRDHREDAESVYAWRRKKLGLKGLSNMGGFTVAEVMSGDEVLATGEACCRADEPFNRAIGRDVALGRALKALREKGGR